MQRRISRNRVVFFMPFLARFVTLVLMMLIGGYGAAHAQTMMEMEEATDRETAARDFLGLEWGAGIGVMGGFGGDAVVEKASIVEVGTRKIVHVEEEGNLRPQLFLEMHVFLGGGKVQKWRDYQQKKATYQMWVTQEKARARERQTNDGEAGESQILEENTEESQNPEGNAGESQTPEEKLGEGQTTGKPAREWPDMPEELPEMGFGPFIALQSGDDNAIDALALGFMWGFRKIPSESVSMNVGIGVSFDPSVQVLAKGFKEGGPPPNDETAVRFKKEGQFGWVLMASFTF